MSSNFKAARSVTGEIDGAGVRVAVICGRFNDLITNRLLEGALGGLGLPRGARRRRHRGVGARGVRDPAGGQALCASSGQFDAVICLGAVIRGDTAHFEYVAGPCAEGIQRAALDTGVPIVFGVLTTENLEQALSRSDLEGDNKGEEAAHTALEMVDLLRRLPAGSA